MYFDRGATEYLDIPVGEQVEVLWLLGDAAGHDDEPQAHARVVVGHVDGHTTGGHRQRGVVWPTMEGVVEEAPSHRQKRWDPETGSPSSTSTWTRAP